MALPSKDDVLLDPNLVLPRLKPDRAAFESALQQGHDLRTTSMGTSAQVRLLTYALQHAGETTVLQVGRDLRDQERVPRLHLTSKNLSLNPDRRHPSTSLRMLTRQFRDRFLGNSAFSPIKMTTFFDFAHQNAHSLRMLDRA